MLTANHVRLISDSFALAATHGEALPTLFYTRLFELDPALRPLFKQPLAEQGRKLVHMLAFVVANLDKPELLLPSVQRLGERHAGYGVEAQHYATVGAALLWALEQALGERLTPEAYAAWQEAYGLLADIMQHASSQQAQAA